ncbi:hypothetical protein GCM10011505_07400 [Tistrella bauzanensis]|uniref:Uncharacterized protein n=1 Tax=Tistrella bauzanensis TaxID=657419 RepID=A0ABQ1I9E5_9PROT|nr:hypothetical protein [Tistrella bauzanensis]GGB28641.1 hypothetical protein GCM10011505_07400 [Tistrella bauzanensis]
MQEQSPESIEQRMTRILKRVIIGLGIAIAIVGVGIGVLIYQRSVANKDDKAGLPVATGQTQAPAAPAAQAGATPTVPAPSDVTPVMPGRIVGDFGAARPPMAPATAPRGAEGPALLPGERVVTLAAAGEDVMMVAEGEGGAQVLVVIDRSSGLLIRRVPLNAAAAGR